MNKHLLPALLLSVLCFTQCGEDILETTNTNAPDLESTLQDPNDWEAVIQKQFNIVWHATQELNAAPLLAGMADVYTSPWGSYGFQYLTSEPRVAILNDLGTNLNLSRTWVEYSYYQNFKVIGSANDILWFLKERPDANPKDANGLDIREKLRSAALFLRGMAYGNLALKYDQAQYVDENTDLSEVLTIPFEPYQTLVDKAIADLETALTVAQNLPDFSMTYYNGVNLDKSDYRKLIRTLQAKYRMHASRDAAENKANDWPAILSYAEQGLDFDFVVTGDGAEWYDAYKWIAAYYPFPPVRIDYRVIAAMAENTPSRFPEDNSHPLPEPKAVDQRLLTDMAYVENINFNPAFGLYHFSHYLYRRYGYFQPNNGAGPMPWILKAENDLIIAEALIRTGGDKARAAELINITRVGRGGLPALTSEENNQVLLDGIMHEQMIELFATNGGQPFYDRRRRPDDDGSFHPYSGLQPGTPRQFPVPAQELTVMGMEVYTFGGD